MKTKNGIATHVGAGALITASTPWFDASGASIVGSRSPKSPSRIIGIVMPTTGQNVTAREGLDCGRDREESLANGYHDATSAKHVMRPSTKAPRESGPATVGPCVHWKLGARSRKSATGSAAKVMGP